MASPKKKFPGRQDELPAVAGFLAASFNRDLALFTDYSTDFNAAYATNFNGQIDAVNAVVFPVTLTKEGKLVTARITTNLARLNILNNLVDSYVKRPGIVLTVAPSDFGCIELRRKIKRGDVEGVLKTLHIVLQNMDTNFTALKAKGLKPVTKTEMETFPGSLTADNTLQNTNIQTRNQLVNDNVDLFDALYETMKDVAKTGKVIHTTISGTPERVPDFTVAVLLRRVRAEKKKGGGEKPPAGG